MRPLSPQFQPYGWALSTKEIAARAGIPPEEVLRFDGNTPPEPPPTASVETVAEALKRINAYRHGGFPELLQAIADYNGVGPENVVLGAGADDILMLCARSFAGPGDRVAIVDEPTYPVYRVATWIAGAEVGDENPALTFTCRPHNPTGALGEVPSARPLVVDEAYYEYAEETAVGLIDDDVIVVRTFSKAFGLASARIGYGLASSVTAAELNARQEPAPVSTLSAALALAGLEAGRPDVSATIAERQRLANGLRALGLEPLPSWTNFLLVRHERAADLAGALLRRGMPVRQSPGALRITVHRPEADDRLLDALRELL